MKDKSEEVNSLASIEGEKRDVRFSIPFSFSSNSFGARLIANNTHRLQGTYPHGKEGLGR